MIKKIDAYIIKKFLGTYFFSLVLILSIAIVFDLTEKMDDFLEQHIPLRETIFDYYANFVPYYMNMFSQMFIFISVIFFTSKMAEKSEIIAILASGVSYNRLMLPYFISALLLFILCFWMGGFVIPHSTGKMLAFQNKYLHTTHNDNARNIQMEVTPGRILFIDNYQKKNNTGYRVSLEHFDGKRLISRITADKIIYDSLYCWHLEKYTRRDFDNLKETLTIGKRLDTIIPLQPYELFILAENAQEMTNTELRQYIIKQRERGTGNLQAFETEWWKRWAGPTGAFIMTLLGVTLSSRKVRGGMGKNLGIGVALTIGYILFSTVSTSFSVSGVMSPFMSVWLPNFIFLTIGILLYRKAKQ